MVPFVVYEFQHTGQGHAVQGIGVAGHLDKRGILGVQVHAVAVAQRRGVVQLKPVRTGGKGRIKL